MIKQKAPKDMTISELLELIDSGRTAGLGSLVSHWSGTLRIISRIPAPNPFTEDQIAVMRELQRNGMNYAAKDLCGEYWGFNQKPTKLTNGWSDGGAEDNDWFPTDITHLRFICDVLSWDDPEPLCFADYAPLEEKHD